MKRILAAACACLVAVVAALAGAGVSVADENGSDVLAKIKQDGVVRVATTAAGPPDSYKADGGVTGVMPELMKEIAKRWGVTIDWQIVSFSGLISSVTSDRADIMADALFISPKRAQEVAFTHPIYGWSDGILLNGNDTRSFTSLEELKGQRVGVLASSVQYDTLAAVGGIDVVSYEGYELLTQDLSSGRIVAGLVDPPSIDYILKLNPALNVRLDKAFTGPGPSLIGFAVAKHNSQLADDLNAALLALQQDGSLARIVHEYAGQNLVIPDQNEQASSPVEEATSTPFFTDLVRFFPDLMRGLQLTLLLTVVSLVLSTALGLAVAFARMSSVRPLAACARVYIDVMRGTPLLVQLFFIYYGFPQLGITLDGFVAGVLALTINYGAYLAEIFRGGIEGLPVGQTRAADALGFSRWHTLSRVVLPQAFRTVFPTYVGMSLSLIKDTSLVSIITLQELLYSGQIIVNQTFKPLEFFAVIALIYLVVSYVVSFLAGRLEQRLRIPGSQGAANSANRRRSTFGFGVGSKPTAQVGNS
jgi:glutamine transport system permease protein